MKILIAVPNRTNYVAAWCLEQALVHVRQGDEVLLYDLSFFDPRYRNFSRWIIDILAYKKSVLKSAKKCSETYGYSFKRSYFVNRPFVRYRGGDKRFESLLRAANASNFGRSDFEIDQMSPAEITSSYKSYVATIQKIARVVDDFKPELVMTVNGRFVVDGAILQFCREKNIEYRSLENTSENSAYMSVMKKNAQFCPEVQDHVSKAAKVISSDLSSNAEDTATKYFENKRNFFSISQNSQRLIEGQYVAFFPTSDYEFAAFETGVEVPDHFATQKEAFLNLAEICSGMGQKIVVRAHPQPSGSLLGAIENEIWEELAAKVGCQLFGSDSQINSYSLAQNAKFSVVFGSSIGAEIAFLGLPVVILGQTTYSHLIPELNAFTYERLLDYCKNPISLKNRDALIPWGFYMATGHTKMEFIRINSADSIEWNGIELVRESYIRKITHKVLHT